MICLKPLHFVFYSKKCTVYTKNYTVDLELVPLEYLHLLLRQHRQENHLLRQCENRILTLIILIYQG